MGATGWRNPVGRPMLISQAKTSSEFVAVFICLWVWEMRVWPGSQAIGGVLV